MNSKKKQKKVQMPASIRKKMMAATSMLLVSAIMLVSSSYAWFTLSTAPEVTGITTSVGANGNLEIALLTKDTYGNTDQITSNTSDSMEAAGKSALAANITWGNLIDLSDSASYGLNLIKLNPSALNATDGTLGSAPLQTPVYGADGRVSELVGNTAAAGYVKEGEVGSFAVSDDIAYGVRAVGTASNMSARQITFKSARSTYYSKVSGIAAPIKTAVGNNQMVLLGLATGGEAAEYSYAQLQGMRAIAVGTQTSLNTIVSAYANAGLAKASSNGSGVGDDAVSTLRSAISGVTKAEELKTLLNTAGVNAYDSELNALADSQTDVNTAITTADGLLSGATEATTYGGAEATSIKTNIAKKLLGDSGDMKAYTSNGDETGLNSDNITNIAEIYLQGGAIGTVAGYTGSFEVVNVMVSVKAGTKDGTTGKLANVTTSVQELKAPDGNAVANITDTYGYIMDFAFRTNAADSKLQLQTEAKNRVYSTETNSGLATQGAGSNITFTYANGLNASQAQRLLDAIRVVFFDPDQSTIYGTAKVVNVSAGDSSATGSLKLVTTSTTTTYTLGKDAYTDNNSDGTYEVDSRYTDENSTNYKPTVNSDVYNSLEANTTSVSSSTTAESASPEIVSLTQNTVQKVSVLVYMDGENIDNTAVLNAASSGSLKMNLQFSSSASLTPMENTSLKTMEKQTQQTP